MIKAIGRRARSVWQIAAHISFLVAPAAPVDDSVASLRQQLLTPALGSQAQSHLKHILAAPEFGQATRQPTIWDRWKQEFAQWLAQQLTKVFQAAAQHPTTSQVIFWVAALAALAFIGYQLFRLWNRGNKDLRTAPLLASDSTLVRLSDLLAAARHAAVGGDLNLAIEYAYWAGVLSLQAEDSLPRDAVLTPRELLASLRRTEAAAPLRMLTNAIETFWYAHRPATEADFALCLRSLEALGCKLD